MWLILPKQKQSYSRHNLGWHTKNNCKGLKALCKQMPSLLI